jgi:zinc transporter
MTGVTTSGLVAAYRLDGHGGGREIGWAEIAEATGAGPPEPGLLWLHLHQGSEETRDWLGQKSGLDPVVVGALMAEETRPRAETFDDGLLVILRGVNLNPGADPEDMVSLRLWVERERVISVRIRRLMAVQDVREAIEKGRGPASAAELLALLARRLVERMGPFMSGLDETIDVLEEQMIESAQRDLRQRLATVRQQAIVLRRYLAPQREAINRVLAAELAWLDAASKARVRESQDRVARYVEDLDAIRERAGVIQDELANRLAEQMNRTMYLLTVVAAIMLPLGFLTGLLGVNVGGIPGADSPWGFAIVCALMALLVAVQVLVFRRLRWI